MNINDIYLNHSDKIILDEIPEEIISLTLLCFGDNAKFWIDTPGAMQGVMPNWLGYMIARPWQIGVLEGWFEVYNYLTNYLSN